MDLTLAIALSGTAVTLATEVLKSKYIPVPATKHPRLTALVLSVGASLYSVYQYNSTHLLALPVAGWVGIVALTMLVSALTYNHIVKGA